MIINYDYKNLRENLLNLKKYFENLGKLIKIKSRTCIENLFNFIKRSRGTGSYANLMRKLSLSYPSKLFEKNC